MTEPIFSVIVPVYNRRDEIRDLLQSLSEQTVRNFEVILVEDGSTDPCGDIAEDFAAKGLNVKYYYKTNEGRSIARNHGIEHSNGQWLVFFDSDCVIPPRYFEVVGKHVKVADFDCFGGPDAAHTSFTSVQKAINFAMTGFLTTGGIRGGKVSMEKFTPRTFNMCFRRTVYDRVGGFREMFSEDIDMSKRITGEGFKTVLLPDAFVYHKRRVNFTKFFRQVHIFGRSRITLHLLYPGSLKLVHALPAIAVLIGIALVVLSIFVSPWFLLPIAIYMLAIVIAAIIKEHSTKVALLAIPAACIQISGYGTGFIRAWFDMILLRHHRDVENEIALRKGK